MQITMITFWSACHLHLPTQKSFRLRQPWQGRFTPPVEDYQIDKLTVMELEMLGIKVEPKALLQYSSYSTQEEDQSFGLFY